MADANSTAGSPAKESYRTYGYRWIVLVAFMLIAAMTQVAWITFAPITSRAAEFFHTSDLLIGMLSMIFMVVYVIIVIPAAWAIDTLGFRTAVSIGAALTAVFAVTRGIFAANFRLVFASQIGLAIGQPFVMGAITRMAARWFPPQERATATGLGTLSMYLGILAGMLFTPMLILRHSIPSMLVVYGIVCAAAAVVFIALARESPPTPPCPPGQDVRALMFDGLKSMLRMKDFILLMVIFFFGLGIFNGVSTWIEDIVRPRGFTIEQAGLLGGLMLIGGIVGAVVMPLFSDRFRKRTPFILVSLAGMIPGLLGVTFAHSYWLLLASGAVFGFFLLSSGPIGFQYAAEITYPAPEGTSNSLLIVMGQLAGIVFIYGMDALKSRATGSMTTPLLGLVVLMLVSLVLGALLRDSRPQVTKPNA